MAVINHIDVQNATYVDGYKISIVFNDGSNQILDFTEFITHSNKEAISPYKVISNFKKFKVEDGNIVWGKNWDLIFPVHELYQGKIKN